MRPVTTCSAVAARSAPARAVFDEWQSVVASRLRIDGWPEQLVSETASSVVALIEGALLLARVSGETSHLENAKQAALALPGGDTAKKARKSRGSIERRSGR